MLYTIKMSRQTLAYSLTLVLVHILSVEDLGFHTPSTVVFQKERPAIDVAKKYAPTRHGQQLVRHALGDNLHLKFGPDSSSCCFFHAGIQPMAQQPLSH